MDNRYRIVVDGFVAVEAAEVIAAFIRGGNVPGITVDIQEWIPWRSEWVDPTAHKEALDQHDDR